MQTFFLMVMLLEILRGSSVVFVGSDQNTLCLNYKDLDAGNFTESFQAFGGNIHQKDTRIFPSLPMGSLNTTQRDQVSAICNLPADIQASCQNCSFCKACTVLAQVTPAECVHTWYRGNTLSSAKRLSSLEFHCETGDNPTVLGHILTSLKDTSG